MEVKKLQRDITQLITDWDKLRGSKHSIETAFIHLTEEVGELAAQYINKLQRPEHYNRAKLKDALGDVLAFGLYLASLHKVDVAKLMKSLINRDQRILLRLNKQKTKAKGRVRYAY